MRTRTVHLLQLLSVTVLLAASNAAGQEFAIDREDLPEPKAAYSPYVDQHFPQRVFFGDTHHHTILSFDDGLMGTRLGPEDSFRFARERRSLRIAVSAPSSCAPLTTW